MANQPRSNPPEAPPKEPDPVEPTKVTVTASLPLAGLFARDQTRTVERTPFIEALIANGKLVEQGD